jgi:ATP phosphoribosyltransferase
MTSLNNDIEKQAIPTDQLRIALPNKGRLSNPAIALMRRLGLEFEAHERRLSTTVLNLPIELLFINAKNVPEYIQDGAADLGVTGLDLVREQRARVRVHERLYYGHADLIIAVPQHSNLAAVGDLKKKRIATAYPTLTKAYFKKRRTPVEVVTVAGAVEVTPLLGLADAICDITSSGSTLRVNDLRPIATILKSEAVLIGRQRARAATRAILETILLRLSSVLLAERKRYIMMNAPRSILPSIRKVCPGLSAPTIMDLDERNMIAIHSVIAADEAWDVVEKLKALGATGILVIPIEKMTP